MGLLQYGLGRDYASDLRNPATHSRIAANSSRKRATDFSNRRIPSSVANSLGLCARPPWPSPPMANGCLRIRLKMKKGAEPAIFGHTSGSRPKDRSARIIACEIGAAGLIFAQR